jgi:hypothetical protein
MADSLLCTVDEMEEDLQTTIRRRLSRKHHLLQLPQPMGILGHQPVPSARRMVRHHADLALTLAHRQRRLRIL